MRSRLAFLALLSSILISAAPAAAQRVIPAPGERALPSGNPMAEKAAFIAQYDDDEIDAFYSAAGAHTYEFAMLFDGVGGPDVTLGSVDVCLRQSVGDPKIRYEVVVWAADGPGGTPGTELAHFAAVATGVTATPTFDSTSLDLPLPNTDVYIGVRYFPGVDPNAQFCADHDGIGGAVQPGYVRSNESGSWNEIQTSFSLAYNAMMFRAFLFTPGVFADELILPRYQIDTSSPFGTTTLLAVRNLTASALSVDVEYYDVFGNLLRSDTHALGAHETNTVNLRDLPGLGGQGFVRVFGPGEADGTPLFAGDFFLVDVGNDFATGERMRRGTEICTLESIRFLEFPLPGSGTELSVFVENPRGIGGADPESFTVEVFDEAGNLRRVVDFATELHANQIDTSFLTTLDFGTLRFDFSNSSGGFVYAESNVEGRFSVGLDSQCENP